MSDENSSPLQRVRLCFDSPQDSPLQVQDDAPPCGEEGSWTTSVQACTEQNHMPANPFVQLPETPSYDLGLTQESTIFQIERLLLTRANSTDDPTQRIASSAPSSFSAPSSSRPETESMSTSNSTGSPASPWDTTRDYWEFSIRWHFVPGYGWAMEDSVDRANAEVLQMELDGLLGPFSCPRPSSYRQPDWY